MTVLGFPGEVSLVFNFCPRKGLSSATSVRRTPRKGVALALEAKTAETMRIVTTSKWGSCEARLRAEKKWQAVKWIDGPDKTSSDGVGNEDLGAKLGKDESVGRRDAAQLDVQELELEQQPASREHKQKTQKAPPDPEGGTQEAPQNPEVGTQVVPSDPMEEIQEAPPDPEEGTQEAPPDPDEDTREALSDSEEERREAPLDPEETQEASPDPREEIREAPSDPKEETREAPSDPEEETKDVAGPAAGSTDLGGPVIPVPRKLTISCNIPPNNVIAHV